MQLMTLGGDSSMVPGAIPPGRALPGRHAGLALPALDAAESAQVARVVAHLHASIAAAGGWLPFADYMQQALYAPGLGYYSAGATKFGAAGDFVTAPEISALFSEVVATQLAEALRDLPGASVLEFGPGTGRLAALALRELSASSQLPAEYLLLEVSADLRERQRATLAALAGAAAARARWLERLPTALRGVVFANEVLDALPCERFVMRGGVPLRVGVITNGDSFEYQPRVADGSQPGDAGFLECADQSLSPELRAVLLDGYSGELQPLLRPWLAALGATLQQGLVLLVDYGLPRAHYYHPQRGAGTLRCHFRQRAHDDPFSNPGLTDLTCWVDFTAVAEAAAAAGFEVAGFATQAAFLLGGGIEARLARANAAASERERAEFAHGARQLLLPGEMGESVKVMVLAKGVATALSGMRLQDLRGSL